MKGISKLLLGLFGAATAASLAYMYKTEKEINESSQKIAEFDKRIKNPMNDLLNQEDENGVTLREKMEERDRILKEATEKLNKVL